MAQVHLTVPEELLKGLFLGDREGAVAKLLEHVFNAVLNAEATEQLKAAPYERSEDRVSYRNGYRLRAMTTRIGSMIVHMPKFRDGTFSTQLFENYQRSEKALLLSLMEMVVLGVSTRKVGEITETLCGTGFSKSTVSALCANLDPAVAAFRDRPLGAYYPFLIADAIYMRSREENRVQSVGLLIVTGINEEGRREVLGFTVADTESKASWEQLFQDLKTRGLRRVDLVTSDSHDGLKSAIRKNFLGASWQRCQAHFSRNCLDLVPKKYRSEVAAYLKDMYEAPSLKEARARKDRMLGMWSQKAEKAMDLLDEAFDDVTAVFSLPKPYRKRMRTSNSIERLNEELRRRERVIRIFPNRDSLIRLMGSVLMDIHEKWESGKKYFTMDTYFAERDAAKEEVRKSRTQHLQVVSANQ